MNCLGVNKEEKVIYSANGPINYGGFCVQVTVHRNKFL